MKNIQLFEQAKKYIPSGVNSPVRSFNSVGGTPFFTARAKDCYLFDSNGKQYIDYICSWGANIVGHANPYVVEKVQKAVLNGFSYGTPTELEVVFAQKIVDLMPNIDKLRLVSSGTEAVMSAIRLARGYTNKKYIVKFNGCYHGHSDSLLIKAGSGLATFANPSSAGITPEAVKHTVVVEYNNIDSINEVFKLYGNDIACVILEPFAGNMNLVKPSQEFLSTIRSLCDRNNSVLIFDEVMTGFRVGLGSAQEILNIKPDLTTLGKVIGGGMPLAAFGGKAEIMDYLAPNGSVYQAGTLSGNPIAVTCGLATLDLIQVPDFYINLTKISQQLSNGLVALGKKHSINLCADFVGGMFGFYFCKDIPQSYENVMQADLILFKRFFHAMLEHGVYFAPSMYEAGFVCSAHTSDVIDQTLDIADKVLANLQNLDVLEK